MNKFIFQPVKLNLDEITVGKDLTLKQETFCRLYTQNGELFGNATLAFAEAYGYNLEELSREPIYFEDEDDEDYDDEDDFPEEPRLKSRRPKKYASKYDRAYNVCSASASKLLRNPKIDARVKELFYQMLKDDVIDVELIKIALGARKNSDRVSAIREYNQLKGRIVRRKEISGPNGGPIEVVSPEDKKQIDEALDEVLGNGKN